MTQISHKSIVLDKQTYLQDVRKQQPQPRPQVQPVYGICGHVARSEKHTCGSPRCALY